METQRFLIVERGCPNCKKYLGVVEEINLHLEIKNQIKIYDETDTKFGVVRNQITSLVDWEGFPTLFLDGYVKVGVISKDDAKNFLLGYLGKNGLNELREE